MKKTTRKMLTFKQFVDRKKNIQLKATATNLDAGIGGATQDAISNEIQIGNQSVFETKKTIRPKCISQQRGNHSRG